MADLRSLQPPTEVNREQPAPSCSVRKSKLKQALKPLVSDDDDSLDLNTQPAPSCTVRNLQPSNAQPAPSCSVRKRHAPELKLTTAKKPVVSDDDDSIDIGYQGHNRSPCKILEYSSESGNEDNDEVQVTPSSSSVGSSHVVVQTSVHVDPRLGTGKQQYCVYCMKPIVNVPRHFRSHHNKEKDVLEILAIDDSNADGKKKKRQKYGLLVNKGNFAHNQRVKQSGEGELVVKYRALSSADKETVPCPHCLGEFLAKELWRHRKACPMLTKEEIVQTVSRADSLLVVGRQKVMEGTSANINVTRLFATMSQDDVLNIVKHDEVLVCWCEQLMEAAPNAKRNVMSQKLRQMGRLMLKIRTTYSELRTMHDCLKPENFEFVLDCVRDVGKVNEKGEYEAPSAILRLSGYLQNVCDVAGGMAVKRKDRAAKTDVAEFSNLVSSEFKRVSNTAKANLEVRKFNKEPVMPLMDDIVKIHALIDKKLDILTANKNAKRDTYSSLAVYLIAKIILFNRKRSGEVQNIKLEYYIKGVEDKKEEPHRDILIELSAFEKELIKSLTRIEIMGKQGRRVPILLTAPMVAGLKKMVELQKKYVHKGNNLLFARVGKCDTPYDGYKALNDVAAEAKLQNPEAFKSTRMRKHLATMSQMLEISQTDRELLCKFMGHSGTVHAKFYQLPDSILDRSKVAMVLIAFNSGRGEMYKGKALSEIAFEPDVMFEDIENEPYSRCAI